jgi:hypothetical protein
MTRSLIHEMREARAERAAEHLTPAQP